MTNYKRNKGGADIRGAGEAGGGAGPEGTAKKQKKEQHMSKSSSMRLFFSHFFSWLNGSVS